MGNRQAFESDLATLAPRLKGDKAFAQRLYAALCNVDWRPIEGEHDANCMLVTRILPEEVERRVKVWSPEGTREPDPWCNCGLAYSRDDVISGLPLGYFSS